MCCCLGVLEVGILLLRHMGGWCFAVQVYGRLVYCYLMFCFPATVVVVIRFGHGQCLRIKPDLGLWFITTVA